MLPELLKDHFLLQYIRKSQLKNTHTSQSPAVDETLLYGRTFHYWEKLLLQSNFYNFCDS